MATGISHEEGRNIPKGITPWSTPIFSNGNACSPSNQNEAGMETPAHDNAVIKLSNLEIHGDDNGSQGAVISKKKKRGQRAATGTDKGGRGLRQFSMKVCEKVESKGRTTYNEVADELVTEYAEASKALGSNEQPGYDEKNIRRRVYDALNVLMAMDIISKDKKEIQWRGLPQTSLNDAEGLKTEWIGLRNRIEKKAAYLQELEEQFVGYQNLIWRNQHLYGNGNAPSGGVALPFILVQTKPNATVEVEISEDMKFVHFDFNSTPFELHDENYVIKQMKFCETPFDVSNSNPRVNHGEGSSTPFMHYLQSSQPPSPARDYQPQFSTTFEPQTSMKIPTSPMKIPTSPALPGILKSRAQQDH